MFFRCGTTRKQPYWSKRWTPRRGFSSCTGPTPADRSSWRHTRTSKRGLKRWWTKSFIKKCCKGAAWSKRFPFHTVRSCQKMPSSTGRSSTNPRHRFALMRIGRCSFRSLTRLFTFSTVFMDAVHVLHTRTCTSRDEMLKENLSSFLSLNSCSPVQAREL